MAKRRFAFASRAPSVKIIKMAAPRASRLSRVRHHGRRAIGFAGRKALEEKHTVAAVIGAAALGLAEKEGIALPSIPKLGMAGTYGILAWVAGKWFKSRVASHVATGLLAIAAYELAKTGSIDSGSGTASAAKKVTGDVFPLR